MSSPIARLVVPLHAESIVTDAMRRCGRPTIDDGFLGPLRVLCDSLETEADLPLAARRAARHRLIEWVVARSVADDAHSTARPDEPRWIAALPDPMLRAVIGADAVGDELLAWDFSGGPIELDWHVPSWVDWFEATIARGRTGGVLDHAVARRGGVPILAGASYLAVAGALAQRPGARLLVVDPDAATREAFIDAVVARRRRWSPRTPELRTRRYVADRIEQWVGRARLAGAEFVTSAELPRRVAG